MDYSKFVEGLSACCAGKVGEFEFEFDERFFAVVDRKLVIYDDRESIPLFSVKAEKRGLPWSKPRVYIVPLHSKHGREGATADDYILVSMYYYYCNEYGRTKKRLDDIKDERIGLMLKSNVFKSRLDEVTRGIGDLVDTGGAGWLD